jgi:hypothetical protein
MTQHDFNIANQSFPSFRTDLNNFLQAVATSHSGTSLPSGAVAGTIWLDTTSATTPILKYYDGTDNITLATINHSTNTVDFNDSTISTPLAVTGNATAGAEIRLPEDTDNGSNYVALKAPDTIASNLTFTLPATDGTANQVLTTSGAGVLSFTNPPTGFRNLVINGDMQIAQRSTSVASITTGGYYTIDRWFINLSSLGTWTMSQSTDTPTGQGFAKSLKLDCTTADASPSASDNLTIIQRFEGQNLQYLKKGTASAVSLTASFWVKSTKTGTFISELRDLDNARSISKSYTVSVSNTWEKKTITFEGDTTGALDNDNASSFQIAFFLGAGTDLTSGTLQTTWGSLVTANRAVGQVNIADDTANDFLITGVQLEAGTSATDFEFLPIDVSLGRCQRYFEKSYEYATVAGTSTTKGFILSDGSYGAPTTVYLTGSYPYKIEKRTDPTVVVFDSVGNSGKCNREWIGVGTSNNQNATVFSESSNKILTILSASGDNRTNIAFHFTATAEL